MTDIQCIFATRLQILNKRVCVDVRGLPFVYAYPLVFIRLCVIVSCYASMRPR